MIEFYPFLTLTFIIIASVVIVGYLDKIGRDIRRIRQILEESRQ